MIFRMSEITTFPRPNTKITDTAITIDGFNCAVMAKAEQIPNTCMVIGLSSVSGSKISRVSFFESNPIFLVIY
ncbi:MAG: Uncharacterised protein [Flavobacteriaceae bacterium]|nr:MAG: Uncharacterised protein [Flavobacteriaceae bacterium]